MPTYDYKCLECGYTFEHFQRISEEHLTVCPKCNGHIRRLIGAGSAPIFKGSGFYQTDYKKSANGSEKKLENKPLDKKPAEKKSDSTGNEKK